MDKKNVSPAARDIQWGAGASEIFQGNMQAKDSEQVPFYVKPTTVTQTRGISLKPASLKKKDDGANKTPFLFHKKHFILFVVSLMLLGICFFVAGFFCGLWISYKPAHYLPAVTNKKPVTTKKKKTKKTSPQTTKDNTKKATKHPAKPKQDKTFKGERYVVHFGSFATYENAEDLKKRLAEQNISAVITKEQHKGHPKVFRVCSEIGTSYIEAETVAEGLNQQKFLSAVVIPQKANQQTVSEKKEKASK